MGLKQVNDNWLYLEDDNNIFIHFMFPGIYFFLQLKYYLRLAALCAETLLLAAKDFK